MLRCQARPRQCVLRPWDVVQPLHLACAAAVMLLSAKNVSATGHYAWRHPADKAGCQECRMAEHLHQCSLCLPHRCLNMTRVFRRSTTSMQPPAPSSCSPSHLLTHVGPLQRNTCQDQQSPLAFAIIGSVSAGSNCQLSACANVLAAHNDAIVAAKWRYG